MPFNRYFVGREPLSALLNDGNTVAWYAWGLGLTGTTNATAWANQMGSADPLAGNGTGGGPAIDTDKSLIFNGTDHYMIESAGTISQPFTEYLVFKSITWTNNEQIVSPANDVTSNGGIIYQQGLTPAISMYSGLIIGSESATLGTYFIVTAVHNGASSVIALNATAGTSGNAGANDLGAGIILGATTAIAGFCNVQIRELIVRSVADSAATRLAIQQRLSRRHGISL